MKHLWRKTFSFLMAMAMVVSIISIPPANAASDYFHFTDYSTSEDSPTQVNSGTIDIAGNYNGVSFDSISFKIETISRKGTEWEVIGVLDGTGTAPHQEGQNGFRFTNVKLPREGLNRITVTGRASGNLVSGVAYVYFPNVPTVYNVQLVDGRPLAADVPTVVDTNTISLTLKAPNATSVLVQGRNAMSGGTDDYLITNVPVSPGLNKIQIVASNATMSYTLSRDVVYYNGSPIAYDVKIDSTSLEGNPTVGPNNAVNLSGEITGKLIVELDQSNPSDPVVFAEIKDRSGNLVATDPLNTNTTTVSEDKKVSVTGAVYSFAIYDFVSVADYTVQKSDDYILNIVTNFSTITGANFPLPFTYRSGDSPIIEEVRQLYNVTEPTDPDRTVQFSSSSLFTEDLVFFQTPIWLSVKTRPGSFDLDDNNYKAELTTTVGGNLVGDPAFTYVLDHDDHPYYQTSTGELVFKITNLPAGEQILNITLTNTIPADDESVTKHISLNYVPTPFIDLDNMYNGKIYHSAAELSAITGKLINFNLDAGSPDLDSFWVTVNGTTHQMKNGGGQTPIDTATGTFNYPLTDLNQQLVDGPNRITITGMASGVPVTTSITVYLFSDQLPRVVDLRPVPVTNPRSNNDADQKFMLDQELAYTTHERAMDVLFSVSQADSVSVSIDGDHHTSTTAGTLNPEDLTKMIVDGSGFRLINIPLPATGVTSVTVTAARGTTTASQTLQITRVQLPYVILSPILPEEQVINQNFINVSIRAEGADQILLGKEEMVRGEGDIFRAQINNLKKGNNTIKFTITTGGNKQNGQFVINYAAQNEVGAQYKAPMPSSGKLSAFNDAITIQFPRGTMLRTPENKLLDSNMPPVDLFNAQQLMLGIADPHDGRTIKRYNRVGEMVGNVPQDGNFAMISPRWSTFLNNGRAQFRFASELFWVDAGFYNADSSKYEVLDGMHPYHVDSANNRDYSFALRGPNQWFVPTNRGEVTLKYDPSIRNESAKNLSVWYFSDNIWKNIGGTVNTSRKTITAPMEGFGYYAVMSVRYGFDDITGHRYARNYLDTMFAKGIMEPMGGSIFGVYDNITRGEFATMIVKILDLPLNYDLDPNKLTFQDVPPFGLQGAMWDFRHVETAARAGIISGMGPRVFRPGDFLTREQAAAIIARAMNYKLGTPEKDLSSLTKQFVDAGSIEYYALTSVQAVVKDKIMQGSPNPLQEGEKKPTFSFNPKSNLNRADMAIIAYNIMAKLRRI